jgi:hypothetical protein
MLHSPISGAAELMDRANCDKSIKLSMVVDMGILIDF